MALRGILKEHSTLLNITMRLLDWVSVVVALFVSHRVYLGYWEPASDYVLPIVLGFLLMAWLFPSFGLYRAWRGASILDEMRQVFIAWSVVFIALAVFATLTKTGAQYSRGWGILWYFFGLANLLVFRVLLRKGLRELRKRGFNQRSIVIAGTREAVVHVIKSLKDASWTGLHIEGVFLPEGRDVDVYGVTLFGNFDGLKAYVHDHEVDQVWIAMPLRMEDEVRGLMEDLRHETLDIRYIPDLFGMRMINQSITDIAGLPVINFSATPMIGANRIIKALEDRILSFLILIFISPLLLIIAVTVKLSSPGPVIFKQLRHGWDGRLIKVYKFRSMKLHEEESGTITQATKNDSRITPFGAFLRKTSLDELPQFFNVLQGKMSIVGPRPHAVEHNELYKDQIDQYMLRHKVKPGITGWAQINGFRGETDTLEKMEKRIEYDLFYIENWSLWFDLKIILLTIFKGFTGKNAF